MQTVRVCRAGDRDACLALFDGNTPRFFDPSERARFAAWLDQWDMRLPPASRVAP